MPGAAGRSSTRRFPELDHVLDELVSGVRSALEENFVGAYLTGSFALGDADEWSDVDFLVATRDEVTEPQLAALQALHRRLHAVDVGWAQHLEGSYAPCVRLRRLERPPSAFWFLDNGANELVRDTHCNTAVVRWVLGNHGVVLAGPDARTLVEPITAEDLRSEAIAGVREYADWAPAPSSTVGSMSKWKQTYLVVTFCRLLHTLEFGGVVSKRLAAEWAVSSLEPEWSELVRQAQRDRPDPWTRVHQPAEREVARQTLAFADYARSRLPPS